jgi:hypothetical protein
MALEDESLYMEQNLKQIFCFGIEMTAYMSSSSSANLSWISLGSNRPLFTIFRVSAGAAHQLLDTFCKYIIE